MPTFKCYNTNQPVKPFTFYVLAKGLNSGKPLEKPCPNCFTVTCKNGEEMDFYFTLTFGLWKSKSFHYYLAGSVIPFLRIDDFKDLVLKHAGKLQDAKTGFIKSVLQVKLIEQRERQIREQLKLLNDLKITMIRRHL